MGCMFPRWTERQPLFGQEGAGGGDFVEFFLQFTQLAAGFNPERDLVGLTLEERWGVDLELWRQM